MLVAKKLIKVRGEKFAAGSALPADLGPQQIHRLKRLDLVQEIEDESEPEPEPEEFECDECEFSSTSKGGLTLHQKTHESEPDEED